MQDTFEWGSWIALHKPMIKKIFFLVVSVFLLLLYINLFRLSTSYVQGRSSAEQVEQSIIFPLIRFRDLAGPEALEIQKTLSLNRESEENNTRVDILAVVRNPNQRWVLQSLVYEIKVGAYTSEIQTTFVLPGETKYLFLSNIPGSENVEPSLEIQGVHWRKIPIQEIPSSFVVKNVAYQPVAYQNDLGFFQGEVMAEVLNRDAHGFREVQNVALLVSQEEIIGAQEIKTFDWLSNETRNIRFLWPKKFPLNSEIKVFQSTDRFDPKNLILPTS